MRRWGVTLALALLSAAALAAGPAPSTTGTVWITLRPQPSGPLKSARVLVEGKEAPADPSGAYRVDGLAGGWVAIRASAEGFEPLEHKVQLPAGGQTSVFLPLERIREPGTLRGRILRQGSGAGAKVPLADVEVRIGDREVARSDADGRFVLSSVGPGPVSLKFAGTGVRPQEEVVVIPPGGEATVEIAMLKAEEILAWMRGRVRSTLGRPLQATLKVPEAKLKARTRPSGDFEFRLPAGRYQVTFEARGHISQTKTVDVGAGDQALFYVDLSPQEN